MKKKIAKVLGILACFLSLVGVFALVPTTPAFAENICDMSNVPEEVKKASGCSGASTADLSDTIQGIVNGIILVLGTVAVVFILVGGLTYMTSTGDPGKVKKAKDTILYAAIGLIICALAFAITNFVIGIIYDDSSDDEGVANSAQTALVENYAKYLD